MKRFKFRLESVLRLRRFELDRARAGLASLERERAQREAAVRTERSRLETGQALLEEATAAGRDGERIAMRADAVTAGRFRLGHAKRRCEELEAPIGEARRRVAHAHSRVRSLERLEEEAEATHRREGLAAEQAEIEELAIGRYARGRRSSRDASREDRP